MKRSKLGDLLLRGKRLKGALEKTRNEIKEYGEKNFVLNVPMEEYKSLKKKEELTTRFINDIYDIGPWGKMRIQDISIDSIPKKIANKYYIRRGEEVEKTFLKLVTTVYDLEKRVKELELNVNKKQN